MSNPWIEHVKKYASQHNLSYACALSTPECKESYQRPENYQPQLARIGKLIQKRKFEEAKAAFNTLQPMIRALPDSSRRDKYLVQMTYFRKTILRNLTT